MPIFVAGAAYDVVHEMPGRMRLRPGGRGRCSAEDFAAFFGPLGSDLRLALSEKSGSVLLTYGGSRALRLALRKRAGLPPPPPPEEGSPTCSGQRAAALPVRNPLPGRALSFFFPSAVNAVVAVFRAVPYILRGVAELLGGSAGLKTLDAAALCVCILRRDFRALSSILFFFSLGSFLEYRTRKKSHEDLAEILALNITRVWVRDGAVERETAIEDLRVGDVVVVRAGSVVPVDGSVVGGEALVNQAGMTGEPLPVRRSAGLTVYAGTVVEEGELFVSTTKVGGERRIDAILRHIENSEYVKAGIQSKYERIADGIVPYNFLLAFFVWLLTRDAVRAGSVLLVDYSCAIRLATPLTVLSAMREAACRGALVKGGRFLEALSEADVFIFDKTGTLTEARPEVAEVIPFARYDADSVLRFAACLEEHFPHPVGRAVVHAAERKNLKHREEHAEVEFVVAHGIATRLRGTRMLVGSRHFIVEDEGIVLARKQEEAVRRQAEQGRSVLYLAVGKTLAGIIAVEDLLRPDMPELVEKLRLDGFKRIIMLTGDEPATAKTVARRAGIDEFGARLLPEEKARFVADLQKEGARVLMMGDGMNDAPALSAASVGVALTHGADMAKEIADIVLTRGDPSDVLPARRLAGLALERIRNNFHLSLFWNSLFLSAALGGFLSPGVSALFHNACTAALAVRSMTPLLPDDEPPDEQNTSPEGNS